MSDDDRTIPRRKGYRRFIKTEAQLQRILATIYELPPEVLDPRDQSALLGDFIDLYRDVLGTHKVDAMMAMKLVAALVDVGVSLTRASKLAAKIVPLEWGSIKKYCERDRDGFYSDFLEGCRSNTVSNSVPRLIAANMIYQFSDESEFVKIFKETPAEFEKSVGTKLQYIPVAEGHGGPLKTRLGQFG
jgi:hypothetical protein